MCFEYMWLFRRLFERGHVVHVLAREEAEWIRRSIAGDHAAFAEIVSCYRSTVVALAYRLCGDPATAEDVAQDAFVHVWQALPRFRGEASLRTWLCRIASNTAIQRLRSVRPVVSLDGTDLPGRNAPPPQESTDLADETPGLESQTLRHELGEAVRRAVLALPPQSRAALVLREYNGLSYREIAAALGIPIGTVMSRLNYARQRLRQELAGYVSTGPLEEA